MENKNNLKKAVMALRIINIPPAMFFAIKFIAIMSDMREVPWQWQLGILLMGMLWVIVPIMALFVKSSYQPSIKQELIRLLLFPGYMIYAIPFIVEINSVHPLRISSIVGILFSIINIILLGYIVKSCPPTC